MSTQNYDSVWGRKSLRKMYDLIVQARIAVHPTLHRPPPRPTPLAIACARLRCHARRPCPPLRLISTAVFPRGTSPTASTLEPPSRSKRDEVLTAAKSRLDTGLPLPARPDTRMSTRVRLQVAPSLPSGVTLTDILSGPASAAMAGRTEGSLPAAAEVVLLHEQMRRDCDIMGVGLGAPQRDTVVEVCRQTSPSPPHMHTPPQISTLARAHGHAALSPAGNR